VLSCVSFVVSDVETATPERSVQLQGFQNQNRSHAVDLSVGATVPSFIFIKQSCRMAFMETGRSRVSGP